MDHSAIQQLQKDSEKPTKREEALKKRASILRSSLLEQKKYTKRLIGQYESVVTEQKKIIEELMKNAPKLFYLYLVRRYNKFRGKEMI